MTKNDAQPDHRWRNKLLKQVLLFAFLLATLQAVPGVAVAQAAETSLVVTNEQWSRVRGADEFMAIPGLKELVGMLDQSSNDSKQTVLEIRYAGGEDGQLWARQVRNRLVGLGIESNRIELVQGVSSANQLEISLESRR